MAKATKTVSENVYELEAQTNAQLPQIKGLRIRWVNLAIRGKNGWGLWKPVHKDTRIGELCEQYFTDNNVFREHVAGNEDSPFLYNGAQEVLGFADDAEALAHRKDMAQLADDQLRTVMQDPDVKGRLRYVTISADPNE